MIFAMISLVEMEFLFRQGYEDSFFTFDSFDRYNTRFVFFNFISMHNFLMDLSWKWSFSGMELNNFAGYIVKWILIRLY